MRIAPDDTSLHFKLGDALAAMELSLKYTPEAERLNPQMCCARYMAKAGDHKGATKRVQELIGKPSDGDNRRWFYWDAAWSVIISGMMFATIIAHPDAEVSETWRS